MEGCTPSEKVSSSSVHHPVLNDCALLLGRRGVRLSRNCLRDEDVLLEEALLDELFQISLEGPTMDGLVSLQLSNEQYSSDLISDGLC